MAKKGWRSKAEHLTAKERRKLPSSDFALPGRGEGPGGKGSGSYPIDTPNRARNALSRAAQFASPAEQATIRRAVARKYPDITQKARADRRYRSH